MNDLILISPFVRVEIGENLRLQNSKEGEFCHTSKVLNIGLITGLTKKDKRAENFNPVGLFSGTIQLRSS